MEDSAHVRIASAGPICRFSRRPAKRRTSTRRIPLESVVMPTYNTGAHNCPRAFLDLPDSRTPSFRRPFQPIPPFPLAPLTLQNENGRMAQSGNLGEGISSGAAFGL